VSENEQEYEGLTFAALALWCVVMWIVIVVALALLVEAA